MRRYLNGIHHVGFVEIEAWEPRCWINIESPEQSDYDFLASLNIPHSFIESVNDPDERPRMEHDNGWLLTVIRIPVATADDDNVPFITVPMGIISKEDIIVTICNSITEMVPDFIDHTHRREISVDGIADFILRLIYSSTYWFLQDLKIINEDFTRAGKVLRKSIKNDDLIGLMDIQKTLVYFNTSIKGNEVLLERVQHAFEEDFDGELLENIEVEIKQAANTIDVYTEILSAMMDSYASIISNNVNDIMKKMTGVSVVLMFPTLIASFYGMNVAMDYTQNAWAFWVIVIGSVTLAVILYFVLRKIRWL